MGNHRKYRESQNVTDERGPRVIYAKYKYCWVNFCITTALFLKITDHYFKNGPVFFTVWHVTMYKHFHGLLPVHKQVSQQ